MAQERFYGEAHKTTMVCIDSYEQSNLTGRFYNLGQDSEGYSFNSSTQFLLGMEHMMNEMNMPQPYTKLRSFAQPSEARLEKISAEKNSKGQLATFVVKVLYRQNSSWQGTITWVGEREEQCFRSVLELILLMDSALDAGKTKLQKKQSGYPLCCHDRHDSKESCIQSGQ